MKTSEIQRRLFDACDENRPLLEEDREHLYPFFRDVDRLVAEQVDAHAVLDIERVPRADAEGTILSLAARMGRLIKAKRDLEVLTKGTAYIPIERGTFCSFPSLIHELNKRTPRA